MSTRTSTTCRRSACWARSGEPINPEAWVWYREVIGGDRVPVVDTWWQTETGMILITPLPGVTTLKPGSATKPFPGVDAAVYDEQGNEVGPGVAAISSCASRGPRCCAGSTRSTTATVETYWSKYPDTYFAGDGARIDEDGDFWLLGRVDDVMNVSGHRISTIEVESALVDHQEVAEAAVAARADATTGQAIVAFVSLKGGEEGSVEMLEELREPRGARRSARSRSRRTSSSRPSSRRPAAARSCAASSETSPKTARSETRRRSPTRPWSRRSATAPVAEAPDE